MRKQSHKIHPKQLMFSRKALSQLNPEDLSKAVGGRDEANATAVMPAVLPGNEAM